MSHIHDAPVDKSTISGGLGLTSACFDSIAEDCFKVFKEQNSVSDTLLVAAKQVRSEELDVPGNLSRYEKKLLLVGYFVGKIQQSHKLLHSNMDEILKQIQVLMELGGKKSEEPEGED